MYEITNFGPTGKFPGPKGNIEILRKTCFETDDKELADYITRFPFISVKNLEKEMEIKPQIEPRIESLPEKMSDLHKLAKERGVKTLFGMTKDKIKALIERGV